MIATRLKIGPADHGREVSEYEAEHAEYAEGYRYELIEGGYYVSPQPHFFEHRLESWLRRKLERYSEASPESLGWVANKARVFVPDRRKPTAPEPDLALYAENLGLLTGDIDWEQLEPFLVVEVLFASDPEKDLVRNVELYWQVPSIAEYWIVDGRGHPDEPTLIARRRGTKRWIVAEVPFGEIYTTPVLPGFELIVDPKR